MNFVDLECIYKRRRKRNVYAKKKWKEKGEWSSSYTTLTLAKNFGGLLMGFWEKKGAGLFGFGIYSREGKYA